MAVIVADSDVLIDFLRGREPSYGRVVRELRGGGLATTVINAYELLSGAHTTSQIKKVEVLLEGMTLLDLDEPASRQAADLRRELEAAGNGIGTADYLIAGICLTRSAALLTRNRSHFERVKGLVLGEIG